jgi:hypothetical protein
VPLSPGPFGGWVSTFRPEATRHSRTALIDLGALTSLHQLGDASERAPTRVSTDQASLWHTVSSRAYKGALSATNPQVRGVRRRHISRGLETGRRPPRPRGRASPSARPGGVAGAAHSSKVRRRLGGAHDTAGSIAGEPEAPALEVTPLASDG